MKTHRPSRSVRTASLLLCVMLLFTLFPRSPQPAAALPSSPLDAMLAPLTSTSATAHAADASATIPTDPEGVLRFATVGNTDDDPTTNPAADEPAAVVYVEMDGHSRTFGGIQLLVDVDPQDPSFNPADIEVTARAWRADDPNQEIVNEISAPVDVYGAAMLMLALPDTSATYHYQVSAPGWTPTEVRTASFDTQNHAVSFFNHDLDLETTQHDNGMTHLAFHSDEAMEQESSQYVLSLTYLPEGMSNAPVMSPMPDIVAEAVDANSAEAELFLPPGEYLVVAEYRSATVMRYSEAQLLQVAPYEQPEVVRAEERVPFGFDGEELVRYQTTADTLAYGFWQEGQGPQPEPQAEETPYDVDGAEMTQTYRVDRWQYESVTTNIELDVHVDDGKKRVRLTNATYDPLVRSYEITVDLLLDHAVTDMLTLQVFGKNDVVLLEERREVVLDPDIPLVQSIQVPAELGKPTGLRVVLDDPIDMTMALKSLEPIVLELQELWNQGKITLNVYFGVNVKVFNFELYYWKYNCGHDFVNSESLCKTTVRGAIPDLIGTSTEPSDYNDWTVFFNAFDQWYEKEVAARFTWEAIRGEKGIELTILEVAPNFGVDVNMETSIDPARCPSQTTAQLRTMISNLVDMLRTNITAPLERELKDLNDKMKGKESSWKAFPNTGWDKIGVNVGLGFKFGAGVTIKVINIDKAASGLGVKMGVGGEFAFKFQFIGAVKFTLFDAAFWFGFRTGSQILDLVETGRQYIWLVTQTHTLAMTLKALEEMSAGGGGDCDPPDPDNGHPDDRLDAWQGGDQISKRLGLAGDRQTTVEQLQRAEELGLQRAVVVLRRDLAASNHLELGLSATYQRQEETERLAAHQRAREDVEGLRDGTIPLKQGQTLDQAMLERFNQLNQELVDLPVRQQLADLEQAYYFADAQYQQLRGQELELQRELRILMRTNTVGIVNSGMADWSVGAVGMFGVQPVLVNPVPALGGSVSNEGHYFDPFVAPAVLIVPTGGLYRFVQSEQASAWLEAYVEQGGTLIALAQHSGEDWTILPGGEVRGLGYDEDIFCRFSSVELTGRSIWTDIFNQKTPDLQIDGSFTAWPSNARVLLMRTTGNQMPAMIEYAFGQGRVIATAAYPDYYMNGLQSREDVAFARNLFGTAYLQASGRDLAASVQLGENVVFDLEVRNELAAPIDKISFYSDYYEKGGSHAWRWAVHEGRNKRATSIAFEPLAAGETRTIQVDVPAEERYRNMFRWWHWRPAKPGLFRSSYRMRLPDTYKGSIVVPGPFYRIEANNEDRYTMPTEIELSANEDSFYPGQTVDLQATVTNTSDQEQTVRLEVAAGLSDGPQELTLAPDASETITYETVATEFRRIELQTVDTTYDEVQARQVYTITMKVPQLDVELGLDTIAAYVPGALPVSVVGQGHAPGTPALVRALVDGDEVGRLRLSLEGPSWDELTASGNLELPGLPRNTRVDIEVTLPDGTQLDTFTTTSVPVVITKATPQLPLVAGATQDVAEVQLLTSSTAVTALAEVELLHNESVVASGQTTLAMDALTTDTLAIAMDVPASLPAGDYDLRVRARPDGTAAEAADEQTIALDDLQPMTSVAPLMPDVRDTLTIEAAWYNSTLAPANGAAYTVELQQDSSGQTMGTGTSTPTRNGLRDTFTWDIPALDAGGAYTLVISHDTLPGWSDSHAIVLPEHRLTLDVPESTDAGTTAAITINNEGGVDASTQGTLRFKDLSGPALVEIAVDEAINARESVTIDLDVPAGLISGWYTAELDGQDHQGNAVLLRTSMYVEGLDLELTSYTEWPAYLVGDTINAINDIEGTGLLDGLTLYLRVLRFPSSQPVWMAPDANAGNTAQVDVDDFPASASELPTSLGWTLSGLVEDTDNWQAVMPVTLGNTIIIAKDSDGGDTIESHDVRNAGTPFWTLDAEGTVKRLVVNSTTLGVQTDNGLLAIDPQTGQERWRLDATDIVYTALSEDALVVTRNGTAEVYDPQSGSLLQTIADIDTERVLLVPDPAEPDQSLIITYGPVPAGGGDYQIAAHYPASSAEPWEGGPYTFVPQGWSEDNPLIAGDEQYIVYCSRLNSWECYDIAAIGTADGLQQSDTSVHSDFDTMFWPPEELNPAALHDGYFYYSIHDSGEWSINVLQQIDLETGDVNNLYEPGWEKRDCYFVDFVMIEQPDGTDTLAAVYHEDWYDSDNDINHQAVAIALIDPSGSIETVESQTISELEVWQTYHLMLSPVGLLVVYDTGTWSSPEWTVASIFTDSPIINVSDSDEVEVLRTDEIALSGSVPNTITQDLTDGGAQDLNDNPAARGELWLEGRLFGAYPQDESDPTQRQLVDSSLSSFIIGADTGTLQLNVGPDTVRPDNPATTLDDSAATVRLTARLVNENALDQTYTVTIFDSEGTEIVSQTYTNVPTGESRVLAATDIPASTGTHTYEARTTLGGGEVVKATATVEVVQPSLTATAQLAPDTVLVGETAVVSVEVTNTDNLPGLVEVDLGEGTEWYLLQAGGAAVFSRAVTPDTAGTQSLDVQVSGDASLAETLDLTVEDNVAAVSITGLPTANAGDTVAVELTATSSTAASLLTPVGWTLAKDGSEVASGQITLETAPNDTTTTNLNLGALEAGSYTLTAETRDPRTQAVRATTSDTFTVDPLPASSVNLSASLGDADGAVRPLEMEVTNNGSAEWSGLLRIDGAIAYDEAVTVPAGDTLTFTQELPLEGRSGTQQVTVTLLDDSGTIDQHDLQYDMLLPPARVKVTSLTATPATVTAGSSTTVSVGLENQGEAGRVLVTMLGCDTYIERPLELDASETTTLDLTLNVPADLLNDTYTVRVWVNGTAYTLDLIVTGAYEIDMSSTLDQTIYEAPTEDTEQARLNVHLQERAGKGGTFELRVRYHGMEETREITLEANDERVEEFDLPLLPWSERASMVLLPVHPDGSYGPALLIDTRMVLIKEDPRVSLTADKQAYQAGETVNLTLEVNAPMRSVSVFGPIELISADGTIMWVKTESMAEPLNGPYELSFTLPEMMPTGRYHLRYGYEADERLLPIDVFATDILFGRLSLDRASYTPGAPVKITIPIINQGQEALDVRIDALLRPLTSDDNPLLLGEAMPVTLQPGANEFVFEGQLPTEGNGARLVVIEVREQNSDMYIGGEAILLEMGAAQMTWLETDRGTYIKDGPAQATLSVYGHGPTDMQVQTSDGTVVYNDTPVLQGFTTVSFPVPTSELGSEVLDAELTDTMGGTSSTRAVYEVRPETPDTEPPNVAVTEPANGAVIVDPAEEKAVTIRGTVRDSESPIAGVLVNGVRAEVTGHTWNVTLTLRRGTNYLVITAIDGEGNSIDLDHEVTLTPEVEATLELNDTQVPVNGLVTSTLTLRSHGLVNEYRVTDPMGGDALPCEIVKAEATSGEITVQNGTVQWQGTLDAEPVVITIVSRQTTEGRAQRQAWLQGGGVWPRWTNAVDLVVGDPPATEEQDPRTWLPLIRR